MKSVMSAAGIDCSSLKPHSVRLASVSKASEKGLVLTSMTSGNGCTQYVN